MALAKRFLAGLILASAAAFGQASPPLRFEVSSVRPGADPVELLRSGKVSGCIQCTQVDGSRVTIASTTLLSLLMTAFGVRGDRISGPSWISSQHYEIQAILPAGATKEQLPEMFRALLVERFKLVARRVSKESDVYALVAGKGGLKMETAAASADLAGSKEFRVKGTLGDPEGISGTVDGPAGPMRLTVSGDGKIQHFELARTTPKALADMLTTMLGRPVIDRTGLEGPYHAALDIAAADTVDGARIARNRADASAPPADAASEPTGASVFSAIERLGLKLEPTKAPVESVIIDRIEKVPAEN